MQYSNTQRKVWVIWVGIFIALFVLYSPLLSSLPFGDDFLYIFSSLNIANAPSALSYWNPETIYFKSWPLTYSIIWWLRSLFGENFEFYRVLNITLHFLNIILLYKILNLQRVRHKLLISLFVCFHSLNVVTIFWIFQIKTLLSSFLVLISIYFLLRKKKPLSFFSFSLSLLVKTVGILVPLAFIKIKSVRFLLTLLALFAISFIGIYGLSPSDPFRSFKTTPFHYYESVSFELIFSKISFIIMLLNKYILHFLGLAKSQLIYSYTKMSTLDFILPATTIVVFLLDLIRNNKNLLLKLFIVLIIPILGIVMIPYQKFTPFADHWLYLPNFFFSAYILSKFSKSKRSTYFLLTIVILQTFLTFNFISKLNDTEEYLTNMQKIKRHSHRDEFLIEIYKFKKEYRKALDLSIDSYEYSPRKDKLLINIIEIAHELKDDKSKSFALIRQSLKSLKRKDFQQAKVFLDRIPDKYCSFECQKLKQLLK